MRRSIAKQGIKLMAVQWLVFGFYAFALPAVVHLAVPLTAHAASISPGDLPQVEANQKTLKIILDIVFRIIGAFALLMIVTSGLKYIRSGGDAGKTSEAKNGIIYALIGLVIAISAEALVAYVVHNAPGPGP